MAQGFVFSDGQPYSNAKHWIYVMSLGLSVFATWTKGMSAMTPGRSKNTDYFSPSLFQSCTSSPDSGRSCTPTHLVDGRSPRRRNCFKSGSLIERQAMCSNGSIQPMRGIRAIFDIGAIGRIGVIGVIFGILGIGSVFIELRRIYWPSISSPM